MSKFFVTADERQSIIEKITSNGGNYTGDLTRKVTHLIVFKAEGRKYAAAKNWNIHTVSMEWLDDSIKRGMILEEKCYDPLLPKEERGKGAWTKKEVRRVSLGKRLREGTAGQDDGRRKLRKTASMKLNSQRENLWGDILGKPPSIDPSATGPDEEPTQVAPSRSFGGQSVNSMTRADPGANHDGLVFNSSLFFTHGFSRAQTDILVGAITSLGGTMAPSISDLWPEISRSFSHHFIVVPQTSKPESHPIIPEDVEIVTEFFIEKCMHKKQFFEPRDHVIGRPFPSYPIPSFDKLSICTAGFTGPDLNQVSKTINQLGASYEERFTQQSSVLVCSLLKGVRKQKLDLALAWRVPVVSADWLWECISTGHKVPFKRFMFPELRQKITPEREAATAEKPKPATSSEFESGPKTHKQHIRGVDMSAFDKGSIGSVKQPQAPDIPKEESTTAAHFETAPTHQSNESTSSGRESAPLSEKSASALNKSPSPRKQGKQPLPRKPLARVRSEVCDSETQDDEDYTPNQYEAPAMVDLDEEPDDVGTKILEKEKIAAAERIALSSKLTSLLEASGGATISFESISTREEDLSAPGPRPGGRRKRGIMGRAISNVSVASTGSVDSSSGAAGAKSASAVASFPVSLAADGQEESTQRGPSSTQIEYEDPEAKKSKALLMNKMLGTADGSAGAIVDSEKGKITLKDIQGFQQEAEVIPARSGRSMRRR